MGRYQLAIVSLILLLLVQDGFCYKHKNDYKKGKENKYKNRASEEMKNNHKNNHYRQTRSVMEEKHKMIEENGEEKLSYVLDRPGKQSRSIDEGLTEYETSCPKRSAKSCSKNGQKKKTCYMMMEEENGSAEVPKTKKHQMRKEIDASSAVSAKKTKNMKKKQSYILVEEEPEMTPEDVEYRLVVNKKSKKEKKIMPTYVYIDESGEEGALAEEFSGKTLKKKSANYILEGLDENEVENRTGRRYVIEEIIEETPEESNGQEEEEENETL